MVTSVEMLIVNIPKEFHHQYQLKISLAYQIRPTLNDNLILILASGVLKKGTPLVSGTYV
jgi:hypothetical protein